MSGYPRKQAETQRLNRSGTVTIFYCCTDVAAD